MVRKQCRERKAKIVVGRLCFGKKREVVDTEKKKITWPSKNRW